MFGISSLHPSSSKGIRGSWAGCQLSFHTATSGLQLLQLDLLQHFCDRCLWLLHVQSVSSLQTTYIVFRIGREGSKQILPMHGSDPLHLLFLTYSCLQFSLFYSWRERASLLTSAPSSTTRLTSPLSLFCGEGTVSLHSATVEIHLKFWVLYLKKDLEKLEEVQRRDDQRTGIYVLWKDNIRTNGRNLKDADRD